MRTLRLTFHLACALAGVACTSALLTGCGRDDSDAIEAARPPSNVYKYGKRIRFGERGNSHRHKTTGWSDPETDYTWTDGTAAALSFRVQPAATDLILNMTMHAMMKPPELPSQIVDVSVNGEKIGTWEVSDYNTYSMAIPQKFVAKTEPSLMIDLYIPKASSPAQLKMHDDFRRLGLCVFDLTLIAGGIPATPTPAPTPDPGSGS